MKNETVMEHGTENAEKWKKKTANTKNHKKKTDTEISEQNGRNNVKDGRKEDKTKETRKRRMKKHSKGKMNK